MRGTTILLAAFLCLSGCSTDDAALKEELRAESERSGLALIEIFSMRWNVVVPFDSPERYFRLGDNETMMSVFGREGRQLSIYQFDKFEVTTVGGVTASSAVPPRGFFPMGLSERASRVAYNGPCPSKTSRPALCWAPFDLSTRQAVADGDGTTRFGDWDLSGNQMVYERQGAVYIYDVGNATSRRLGDGHDPTWSPDGKWIAYRSAEGSASLMTTDGHRTKWALDGIEAATPLRWSPDGRYVAFSEPAGLHVPFFGTAHLLKVHRVADGRSIAVRRFGDDDVHVDKFHWVLNYGEFCRKYQAGEGFN